MLLWNTTLLVTVIILINLLVIAVTIPFFGIMDARYLNKILYIPQTVSLKQFRWVVKA